MEKFLKKPVKSGVEGSLCPVSRSLKRGAQRKLKDCKKVVTLEPGTTRVVFGLDTVLQAKEVLDCTDSAPEKVCEAFDYCSSLTAACSVCESVLPGQVLEKLRFLSCLEIDEATLRNSGVVSTCPSLSSCMLAPGTTAIGSLQSSQSLHNAQGFSVRKQKKSANADVAALAARIISKWQGIVLNEQQARKGRRRLAMQPG